MTKKLYEMLAMRYPPINESGRVSTYGAMERVHVIMDKPFSKRMEYIAREIFPDIEFISRQTDWGETIIFEPDPSTCKNEEEFEEHDNYSGHLISISESEVMHLTFHTGNRGSSNLTDKQRKRYFSFAINVLEST